MVDMRSTENAGRASAARPRLLLNVFALPSQSFILAAMLAAVMCGTLAAISVNSPFNGFWLLIVVLIMLSVRGVLAWPDQIIRKHSLKIPPARYEPLKRRIVELAAENGIKPAPSLLLTCSKAGPEAVGAFYRRFIFINQTLADNMLEALGESDSRSIVDAVLLHELSHFKHRDNLWFGAARALLWSGGVLIGWTASFFLGFIVLMTRMASALLQYSPVELAQRFEALLPGVGIGQLLLQALGSDQEWEAMRQQAARLNLALLAQFIFGNTFPLALLSVGLLAFFWNRLMRVRELYADMTVIQTQGDIMPLLRTLYLFAIPLSHQARRGDDQRSLPGASRNSRSIIDDTLESIRRFMQPFRQRVFGAHYLGPRRLATWQDPARIYDGWLKTAVIFGMFILVLEMLLLGTSALFFAGKWPLHVFVLPAFVLLSLYFMVWLTLGQPRLRDIMKIIGMLMVPHSILLILTLTTLWIATILAPTTLARFFDIAGSFYSGVISNAQTPLAIDPEVAAAKATIINLLQLPTIFIVMTGPLAAGMWAMRRMLTWYGRFRTSGDWQRVCYWTIALLAFVLVISVLPPITDLVLARFDQLLAPSRLAGILVGLLVITVGGWWYWKQDQVYARRCAICGREIAGEYRLGRECPNPECGALLNSWLLASYNVDRQRRISSSASGRGLFGVLQQEPPHEQD